MEDNVSIRILQLKNNFYRDIGSSRKEALGKYCVLGYFDAFDISDARMVEETSFNTWEHLGELTYQLDGSMNCRMLVCITKSREEDGEFWKDPKDALFFITMVRVRKEISADDMNGIINKLGKAKKRIGYLSFDHSEIIAVTKTDRYSEGIEGIRELRRICDAVKTYTVFAVKEELLESYESIKSKIIDEKVFCRLHCMVKNYTKAEEFKEELQRHINARNENEVKVRKYETFGGYDWLIEIDDISIYSLLELYKMEKLLTHANEMYDRAFFNIESEILVE